MESIHGMFKTLAPNNLQNKRYLILGSSGSGKTTLAHSLIAFDLRKHRRIVFIEGGQNILLDRLQPIYEDGFLQIERYNLTHENVKEVIEKIEKEIDEMSRRDSLLFSLYVIDDISHLMKESVRMASFLNKMATTSRQAGYDLIVILHSLKLGNVMLRNNCSKIFITSPDKQYITEFADIIQDPEAKPIVIDCETNPFTQVKLNLEEFKGFKMNQFMERIGLTSPSSFPRV